MNQLLKTVAASLAMGAAALFASAVPAYRGVVTVAQPDGTSLQVVRTGDEWNNRAYTVDGLMLAERNGIYHYAVADNSGRIVASSVKASDPHDRSEAEQTFVSSLDRVELDRISVRSAARQQAPGVGLFPGSSFPATGKPKALVVLVEYQDVKFTLDEPYDYFSRLLNEPGFSLYSGTGSVSNYFADNSEGQFTPEFDLFGPITLKQQMSYYGGNNTSGYDRRAFEMVIEACEALDPTIDLSQYDCDGDGYIDNVFVFYAGKGENADGGANTVWPHSSNVTAHVGARYFDGVVLDRYACTNEWRSGRPDGIGTFIHEFSHVMGLPDLYATNSSGAFTPGAWSVLDYGPYNNNGCTPPRYSVFERNALGWVDPQKITEADDVILHVGDTRVIPTSRNNEFFLLENRQQSGWDAYIPGHGMLVWHVDYNSSIWSSNSVNNTNSHQYVDLEEADAVQSEYSRDGDAFPGTGNVTSFTDTTRPSMKTWSGALLGLPLTDIAESADGVISFRVAGGIPAPDGVVALAAENVTPVGFTARWEASDRARQYFVTVSDANGPLPEYTDIDAGAACSLAISSLQWETAYSYTVVAANSAGRTQPSNSVSVTTSKATFEYMFPVVHLDEVTSTGFTAVWSAVPEADSYFLDVYTKERRNNYTESCDFSGGLSGLPVGWTTDSKATYSIGTYVGESAPSLRLNDNYVATPKMSDDIHSISFWNRGNSTPSENSLIVYAYDANDNDIKSYELGIATNVKGSTVTADNLPRGTRQVKIVHNRPNSGAVAIDDIVLKWGGEFVLNPVTGFDGLDVGNTLRYTVDGLQPESLYFCRVTASSGSRLSLASAEVEVIPGSSNGIGEVIADSENSVPEYFDLQGRRVHNPGRGIYIRRTGRIVQKVVIR